MPLFALLALFIAIPLAELFVILQVGDGLASLTDSAVIGALLTILLLAADSVIGTLLLRSQGKSVWRRFNEALATGRVPQQEAQEGVAVIFGGALLITPGFLTDLVGIALLAPPTRDIVMRLVAKRLTARASARFGPRFDRGSGPRPGDVEGTAAEYNGTDGGDLTPAGPQLER